MILVTGGAGYIGSQVVHQLVGLGEEVMVLDNLQTGDRRSIADLAHCHFIEGNLGDAALLKNVFQTFPIQAVMHFAASTSVPESVQDPLKYYRNNTANTLLLLAACQQFAVKQFIFSSTAAVYGIPTQLPIFEDAALAPINPYGESKLMSEKILTDFACGGDMRYVILRYFNVAGADPAQRVGPYHFDSHLLIRFAVQVALGLREKIFIYGQDYATPDGTGVRDYIHVADVATAHIDALHYLRQDGASILLNCGYGQGYSVNEVIKMVEKVSGRTLPVELAPRRVGDPAASVAGAKLIRQVLKWKPQYHDLEKMVHDAYFWEKKLLLL